MVRDGGLGQAERLGKLAGAPTRPSCAATMETSRSRVGSASALRVRARSAAWAAAVSGSRSSGASSPRRAAAGAGRGSQRMRVVCQYAGDIGVYFCGRVGIDCHLCQGGPGDGRIRLPEELRERVRYQYAAARAVLEPGGGRGGCEPAGRAVARTRRAIRARVQRRPVPAR